MLCEEWVLSVSVVCDLGYEAEGCAFRGGGVANGGEYACAEVALWEGKWVRDGEGERCRR